MKAKLLEVVVVFQKIKIQWYNGLAILQNTLQKPNPTSHYVPVSVHVMKKNIIVILNHYVQHDDLKKQHRFFPIGVDDLCYKTIMKYVL